VSRDPHIYVYLNVHIAVNMRAFLAIFAEVLESFGFDFLLTLFEEFHVKGNLMANILGILPTVARRIF